MRKALYILVILLLLTTLGCRNSNISTDTNPKPESKPDIESAEEEQAIQYEKLWNVDIGVDGYRRNYALHNIIWESEDSVVASWSMRPTECSEEISNDMETYESDGVTYYTKDESICWDSYDLKEGGTKHIRRIVFIEGEYQYVLSISADNDKSLLIPVETCVKTLNDPEKGLTGFKKTTEFWYVELKKDDLSVHISIYPSPYGIEMYNDCPNSDILELVEDNETEYYIYNTERTLDDPNCAAVYWLDDIGLIQIHANIPYSERNDVPREALEFINIELAKSIVMQMS